MCDDKYTELICRYIDGDLNETETAEIENHLKECGECAKTCEEFKKIKELLQQTEQIPLEESWYNKIRNKIKIERLKKINYKKIASYVAAAAAFLIVCSAVYNTFFLKSAIPDYSTSSGQSLTDENSSADSAKNNSEVKTPATDGSSESNNITANSNVFDPSKIIYNGTVILYTDNYKETGEKITEYVKNAGGFIENSAVAANEDNRYDYKNYGYLKIRIPSGMFDQAIEKIQTYGEVKSVNTNSTNVTQSYRNIQSELESYKIQESRLKEYLSKADKIADMLSIESELNRVRTEINYRTSLLENYDNAINYSTITITLYEKDLSTSSVSSPFKGILLSIKKALISSVNLILKIISLIIIWIFRLLPFAVIGFGIYILIKKIRLGKNKIK